MDRTPAPDPYPSAQPPPTTTSAASGGHNPALIVFGIGGLLVAIGGLLPRAELAIGPIGVVQTKGIAIGLVLIGALMVFRAFQVYSRGGGRGGAPILFVGSLIALGLVIYDMATAKSDLSHWATTTGAQQLATQFHVPVSEVSSRIQTLLSSSQTHVTYKTGLWLALIGSVLALAAAVWAWATGRGSETVPAGPGWVQSAPAGPGVPPAGPGVPPAPGAAPPTDWTAPPSGWTAPTATAPGAESPTSPPPPAPPAQPTTPPPAPPQEPEELPPPPPPPPS